MKIMKKINRAIGKMNVAGVIVFMIAYVAVMEYFIPEEIILIKRIMTVLFYPIMLFSLQSVLESKRKNNDANLDVVLTKRCMPGTIIWRENKNDFETGCILEISNSGEICIYSMQICAIDSSGKEYKCELDEMITPQNVFYVKIPMRIKDIMKIEISYGLISETHTKVLYGNKTKYEGRTIFSKMDNYNEEKYSIRHKYEKNEFVKLERYYEKK